MTEVQIRREARRHIDHSHDNLSTSAGAAGTSAAREALRGNVVRDLSASLADEVAERVESPDIDQTSNRAHGTCRDTQIQLSKACQSVTPVLQRTF